MTFLFGSAPVCRAGMRALLVLAGVLLAIPQALATCFPVVEGGARLIPAALPAPGHVRLTFLGHSSFLIETPGGATVVTDYNGYNRAEKPPAVVTMNNAHSSHYSNVIEPGVEHALKGWGEGNTFAMHDVRFQDLRVRNVPTNVRSFGGTRYNGNSIFVFEVADLCIAHLGHLHHELSDDHLGKLGLIDVLLVPVDGSWTASHDVMARVVDQIRAPVIIPMHYFSRHVVDQFHNHVSHQYDAVFSESPTIEISRLTLPHRKMIVLPGS